MSSNSNLKRPTSSLQTLALTPYSPKKRHSITFPADSPHTKQEFKDECDINILMSHYISTGQIPNLNERAPQYLDNTAFQDFQQSMNYVASANSLFFEMPSAIRNKFDNSPALFLDFCSQEKNRPEMAEMGLLKPVTEWSDPTPHLSKQNAPKQNLDVPSVSEPSE